jgi:hypothetical protein
MGTVRVKKTHQNIKLGWAQIPSGRNTSGLQSRLPDFADIHRHFENRRRVTKV